MKKLIISPQAGFGNRMRSLVSAKILADYLDRELYHYWVLDERMGNIPHVNEMKLITPDYFFGNSIPLYTGDSTDICYSEWTDGDYWWYSQSTAQSKLKCNKVKKLFDLKEVENSIEDAILIESSHSVIPEKLQKFSQQLITETYKKYFTLNDRWQSIYNSLPYYDWGISIRRGDFFYYFPESIVSIEKAVNIIENLNGTKIIFSDDIEFRNQVRKITNCYSSLDDSLKGIDSYFAQFLTLSKCKNILNTNKSSFGEQAALFGGSNYITFNFNI